RMSAASSWAWRWPPLPATTLLAALARRVRDAVNAAPSSKGGSDGYFRDSLAVLHVFCDPAGDPAKVAGGESAAPAAPLRALAEEPRDRARASPGDDAAPGPP